VHVDVGFEGIDPEELERLCVEAELSRKNQLSNKTLERTSKRQI
jgi:hypothetical protein